MIAILLRPVVRIHTVLMLALCLFSPAVGEGGIRPLQGGRCDRAQTVFSAPVVRDCGDAAAYVYLAAAKTTRGLPEQPEKAPVVQGGSRAYPYALQVGSYTDRKEAMLAAFEIRRTGRAVQTARARIPGKGTWHRVLVGWYRSRPEAAAAADSLGAEGFAGVVAVKVPYSVQVALRGSGDSREGLENVLRAIGYFPYSTEGAGAVKKPRLLVGAFGSFENALALAARLEEEGISAWVVIR